MLNTNIISSLAALSALAGVNASPLIASPLVARAADPPRALPENAPSNDIRFQPVLDYDTDSCYNVPAIDAQGNVCQGLDNTYTSNTKNCRDASDLDNQNVYSRSRCNHGWCAYMYEHYFEKDVGLQYVAGVASGHRHEWENVVIWVRDGEDFPAYVAASQHDGYEIKSASDVRFLDTHAKIIYNKVGLGTHAFRYANKGDDNIENHKGVWIRGALVGWNGYPSTGIRDKMIQAFADGGIRPKIDTSLFPKYLKKSIGDRASGFDFNNDA